MVEDVVGVMKDLKIARAVLGGCSVGSGIAILLGLEHPELFERHHPGRRQFTARAAATRAVSTAIGSNLADYHIKHLRELVAPAFADSRLGGHLLNMWVEREPRLSRAKRSRRCSWPAITPTRPSACRP